MAEIALKGNMKVKTLKADFKKAFGSTLRVYMSPTCKGRMADDEATFASINVLLQDVIYVMPAVCRSCRG